MKKLLYLLTGIVFIINTSCTDEQVEQPKKKDPVVVSINPSYGSAKDIVTILGRNFSEVKSENIVRFNGIEAVILEADPGKLQIVLPNIAEGKFNVEVTIKDTTVIGPEFTFQKSVDNGWIVQTIVGQNGVAAMKDGIGTEATCKLPTSLSFAPDGSIWFTDRGNFAIRSISTDMQVTTIAGEPSTTLFSHPWQGNFDSKGHYYVADKANHRIQKIDGVTHEVTTFATGFDDPMSLVFDANDNMYVADRDNKAIKKITPEGQTTTYPIGMTPNCLILTPGGDIVIGGSSNYTLLRLSLSTGQVTTIAGDGVKGTTYNDGEAGNPLSANIGQIFGLGCDANGAIYIADALYHVIRKFTPDSTGDYSKGTITTIAGTGTKGTKDGKALSATFNTPYAVLASADGKTLYIADTVTFLIRRMTFR